MSKQIPLTMGEFAIVDDEDYEYLSQWKWWRNRGYAIRSFMVKGKRHIILMHRVIMQAPLNKLVDHIDGNILNNQKHNLRICTHSENMRNQHSVSGTSKYKGVYWSKDKNKWAAQIRSSNKKKFLGYFSNEKDAALAYNKAAVELHGEFAKLNEVSWYA